MVFHPVLLNLEDAQKRRLMSGGSVRVKHHQLGADRRGMPIYLTQTQIRRLQKAGERNGGSLLRFSDNQIRHHHGSGILDTVRDVVKKGKPMLSIANSVLGALNQNEHIKGKIPFGDKLQTVLNAASGFANGAGDGDPLDKAALLDMALNSSLADKLPGAKYLGAVKDALSTYRKGKATDATSSSGSGLVQYHRRRLR